MQSRPFLMIPGNRVTNTFVKSVFLGTWLLSYYFLFSLYRNTLKYNLRSFYNPLQSILLLIVRKLRFRKAEAICLASHTCRSAVSALWPGNLLCIWPEHRKSSSLSFWIWVSMRLKTFLAYLIARDQLSCILRRY